jgi:thymidine phosphorylase
MWDRLTNEDRSRICNDLIDIALKRRLSTEEIVMLAKGLANSSSLRGTYVSTSPTFDFCSTGGGNSLTTILPPYLAASQGIILPQLSVPGEIAGAIDTLGAIQGFEYMLSSSRISEVLDKCNIAFFLNTEEFAPADLFLFKLRVNRKAKNSVDLVMASLLSKKISVGVNNFLVDVRVGPNGNFGKTVLEAKTNCKKLGEASKMLGIGCNCLMTNHFVSPMPLFGRLESLSVLLAVANNEPLDEWTCQHVKMCIEIAAYGVIALSGRDLTTTIAEIKNSIKSGELKNRLSLLLSSQGSSMENLELSVKELKRANTFKVNSRTSGYIQGMDYALIRDIFREAYERSCGETTFCSPIGMRFFFREGDFVHEGSTLIEVRIDENLVRLPRESFGKIINLGNEKPKIDKRGTYGVIENG